MWNNQEILQLYHAIFHRKSIRRFKQKSLSSDTVNQVRNQLIKLVPLFPECDIAFLVLDSSQVKGRITEGAYYIAAYTDHSLKSYTNAGFMLQQMDLWLSSQKIGSWWHGLIKPVGGYETEDGLPFAFMLTFGAADEPVHRLSSEEFKRKELSQITDTCGLDVLMEAIRLAPSGRNAQTWYISGDISKLNFYKSTGNVILNRLFPDVHYLDGGIGLCHLWLAAKAQGYDAEMYKEDLFELPEGKQEYICSVKLKENHPY